jgi:antibiotic biosynthesis monooxygenase (ABM) superfamily enzyme
MPYVVRFVQRFQPSKEKEFLALEKEFASLERKRPGLPRGRRLRPFAGRESTHTLVWESEFATLAAAERALATLAADPGHARLLRKQIPFFLEAWTEIYEVLEP